MTDKYEGHTPGPWKAGRADTTSVVDGVESKWVYSDGNAYIAAASGQDVEWSEVIANARLIADAPKLLAEAARYRKALETALAFAEGADCHCIALTERLDIHTEYCEKAKTIAIARRALEGDDET